MEKKKRNEEKNRLLEKWEESKVTLPRRKKTGVVHLQQKIWAAEKIIKKNFLKKVCDRSQNVMLTLCVHKEIT